MESNVEGRPERAITVAEYESKKTHALANLRQAIWEAHQYLSLDGLEDYCIDVVNEIDSDNQEG